eukprot:jgi/Phyca11/132444/e_gw1.167.22.1
MRVELGEAARPYRAGTRRYSPDQRQFLRDYVRELEQHGLVRRNNESRWASPALPVRKPGTDKFRITVDYRAVNRMTVPIAGATPNLASVLHNVEGAVGFGQFDFFKGFWQLPLHESCQELFSFVTEDGVFTPTRVPQGACDSALHFQLQMHACFQEMLYTAVLIWIDDILLFARSKDEYLNQLEKFFLILRERGLKLNALKCRLFARSVRWCGKIVTGQEVKHDPARLAALVEMELPPTAAALQQFLCAANWIRDTVVDFARVFSPLQHKLEAVMSTRGRRRQQLTGVDLTWTDKERVAFKSATAALARSSPLQYPSDAATINLFCDASATGWAIVLTQ